MKISELNTKDFLGKNGAATNSYVLINYAESPSASPITTKATIEELGKSIANQLQLYVKSASGPSTIQVENNHHYKGQLEEIGGNSGGNSGGAASIDVTADQEGNYSYEIPDYDEEDYFDPITMSSSGATLVFTIAGSEPIQERPLLIWDNTHHKAVPYNLANPFYIEQNSSLITRGQNVFVNAADSNPDKLYIMTGTGPSELSIGGGSSGPIIETMQTTTSAAPNQGGAHDAAIVFTPVDTGGYFNGLYGCTENGGYDLLNLGTNLLSTSVEEQNVHYYPLWTDGQGNLYYYDSGSWSQVTP